VAVLLGVPACSVLLAVVAILVNKKRTLRTSPTVAPSQSVDAKPGPQVDARPGGRSRVVLDDPTLTPAVPGTVKTSVVFAAADGAASTPVAASSVPASESRGGRNRGRRTTKENMLSKKNLNAGTDEFGSRVRTFTASLCCERAHGLGLDKFTWEGDTIDSDVPGLRMPGKARHGEGTITYESGDSYTGGWKDDKRSGFGKMTFACGDEYEGQWLEGKYEGHGKYTNVEIGTYEGEWEANHKHGTGRSYYSATGDVYDGSYVEGVREGYGTYTKGNGEVRMGRYEKGELVADA